MEYYSAIRKREIWHLHQHGCTLRALSKCNKIDKDRQIPYDLTYMWNLTKKKNSKHTDKENRLTDWWLLEAGGGRGWK